MIDAAAQGRFTDLIVTNVARLGAVLSDNVRTLELPDQAGIAVHALDGNAAPLVSEHAINAILACAAVDDERIDGATADG